MHEFRELIDDLKKVEKSTEDAVRELRNAIAILNLIDVEMLKLESLRNPFEENKNGTV